jgi:hypothetical protein
VANSTSLDFDANFLRTWLGDLAFDDLEVASGLEICATFIGVTAILVVDIIASFKKFKRCRWKETV